MQKDNIREILLVFFMVLSAYGYFFSQQDSNTNSRLALVKAIVEEKRVEIDSYHDNVLETIDKAYYNGHYYSDKAIGSSLIGVPIYYLILRISNWLGYLVTIKIFKQLLTFFAISLLSAFLAPLLYLFVKRISNSARYALLVTLAICLGTPFYLYSTTYYSHTFTGLFLFIVFYIWFKVREEGTISLVKTWFSGFFLGYAFINEYPSALIAITLGLYIFYIMWEQRRLADWKSYLSFIAGVLIPLSLMMYYNYSIFKSPFSVTYQYEAHEAFRTGIQTGFIGFSRPDLMVLFYMTFHTTMGIFWQSPFLLLAFVGWITSWQVDKKYHIEGIFSFGAILLYFVILSGYYWWAGGLAFTPRYLVIALPFFAVPLAFLPQKFHKLLFALALLSIGQMIIVTSTIYYGLSQMVENLSAGQFYAMFENSTIYTIYLPNFLSLSLHTNRGQQFLGLKGHLSLLPLIILEIILLVLFLLVTHIPKNDRSADG